jgi:DNA-binding transcriptional LysR family regulator
MRVELTTLRLFAAVAEEKNIARAAEREHIAASAVSKRILILERECQTALFRRHQRGVDLTAAGQSLFRHTRNLFSILDRMRGELSEFANGARGHVRIAANTSSIVEYFPEELRSFMSRYPDIRIGLTEQCSAAAVRMVQEGVADLGIIAGNASAGALEILPYRTDRLSLVVPSDHPFADRLSIDFEETLRLDHVGLQEDTSIHALLTQAAAESNRPLNFKVSARSSDSVRRLVQAGLGLGVLPEACIKPYEHTMRLKGVRLSNSWAVRMLNICARDFQSLPMSSRLLVSHLVDAESPIAVAS